MWGMRRKLGPEEQSPRDRSESRLCHVTEYPLLEDCGKTKQSEWSSVTFWSCLAGLRASPPQSHNVFMVNSLRYSQSLRLQD